jgi:CBS domain containing-hemolysin-like protein
MQLNTHFDASEVDSLGGLVFSRLGRKPTLGDEVDIGGGWLARVERLDGLRIARVRLIAPRVEQAAATSDASPDSAQGADAEAASDRTAARP